MLTPAEAVQSVIGGLPPAEVARFKAIYHDPDPLARRVLPQIALSYANPERHPLSSEESEKWVAEYLAEWDRL